jgi:quercetin dioxygenase-like cupin family protein
LETELRVITLKKSERTDMIAKHAARTVLATMIWLLLAVAASEQTLAQGCRPVSERVDDQKGCWIFAKEALGPLPQKPLFWHLDTYATHAEADAAKGPRGTVIEALDKIWLLTIAEQGWRPVGGARVAEIGPLPGISKEPYTAVYMESGNTPGFSTAVHFHDGPEVFYTLVGDLCLETPDGMKAGHAGDSTIAAPGVPMELTTVGNERRRSIALILHETAKPMGTVVSDWKPKGLCKQK